MPGAPASPGEALPWEEFLNHVLVSRGYAATLFSLVFASSLLAAALLPPSYRAHATLAVLPSPEFTVRPAAGSHDFNASALAMDQIMKAEAEILQSDELHAATLHAVGPASVYPDLFSSAPPDWFTRTLHAVTAIAFAPWRVTPSDPASARTQAALKLFAADLDVRPTKDSNVIFVSFDNRDGAVAARTVNTMLAMYAARRSHLYDDPQIDIVRRQAELAERTLREAEARLAGFKRAHDIADFDQQRALLVRRASEADQAAEDARAAITEDEARLAAQTQALSTEPARVMLYRETDTDTRLQAVNAGLQDLRAKLAAASDKYREGSRFVTMLRSEIAADEAEADRLRQDAASSVVRQGRNPAVDSLRLDRDHASIELAAAQARLGAAQSQQRLQMQLLRTLTANETMLENLLRQRQTAEDDYRTATRIAAERRLSEAEDARRLANVRVIQQALTPQLPRPLALLIAVCGLLLACLAAAAGIIVRFVARPVFLTGPGLQAATGLPVLAVFVRQPNSAPERLATP
jgi:uncharacterized protein involved in exopolysaccharide biosynthesis